MLEDVFCSPMAIIGWPPVGMLCAADWIPIGFCFITEQWVLKNPVIYKLPLAKLNTKMIIIWLKGLHALPLFRQTGGAVSSSRLNILRKVVVRVRSVRSSMCSSTSRERRSTCPWLRGTYIAVFHYVSYLLTFSCSGLRGPQNMQGIFQLPSNC
jgi:hypothetical protein